VVRPEAIALRRDGGALAGIVESRVFLGDKAEYLVRANGLQLLVVEWNPLANEPFAVGQAVSLDLRVAGVHLLGSASDGA
jgi:iron(III) transport system ATP-binding protein